MEINNNRLRVKIALDPKQLQSKNLIMIYEIDLRRNAENRELFVTKKNKIDDWIKKNV